MKHTLKLVLLAGILGTAQANAALCSRVKIFTDGSILTASDLNTEFSTIFDCDNSISNDNISPGAAIAANKLSPSIAGPGIARDGTTGVLSANPDGLSIEVVSNVIQIKNNGVALSKLGQAPAESLIGNPTSSTANVSNIQPSSDGQVMRSKAGTIGFGQIATVGIEDQAVTTDKLADANVTTAKIADAAVTPAKIAATGYAMSASTGLFNGAGTTNQLVTSVNYTTTGKPVFVTLIGDGSGISSIACTTSTGVCYFYLYRDSTFIGAYDLHTTGGTSGNIFIPPGSITAFDAAPAAGAHTFFLYAKVGSGTAVYQVNAVKILVKELL